MLGYYRYNNIKIRKDMKTNKIILASLMAVGMLFAACTEEAPVREPSPADNTSIVAYFSSDNATSIEVEPNASFPVVIARDNVADAATFELTYKETVEGAFTFDPTVSFAAGASTATINVTLNPVVKAGEAATLTLTIPATAATYYNNISVPVLDFNVTAGYLWVSAGTVAFMSQWSGGEEPVAVTIEHASDYSDEDGNLLYRLNSPYYYADAQYCTVTGLHVQFLLDKDYNAVALNHPEGFLEFENSGYYLYWDITGDYKQYCQFLNQGNIYAIIAPWSDGASLYGPYQEMWQWVEGYPGAVAE